MEEGKIISYGVVGGYVNDTPLSEAGIGIDWDSKTLILAEQERAKTQQGQTWQRKAAMPMVKSFEPDATGGLTIHVGQYQTYLAPDEVKRLSRACATAMINQNSR